LYANLLSKASFNVIVVTNRFAGEPEVSKTGNLTIYRLSLFKENGSAKYSMLVRSNVLFSSFMRKLMRRTDAIYIPGFWYSAIPLAKAYRKPVITHLHDYVPICPLSNIYNVSKDEVCDHSNLLCQPKCIYAHERTQGRVLTETLTSMALNSTLGRYFGKLVKLSDAVICVSKVQRDMIIKVEPSLRNKTHVIYNPLPDTPYIAMEGDDFGYFGGPDCLKGFHTLCHSIKRVNHANSIVTRIHATKFPNSLKQLAKSVGKIGILPSGKLDNDEYEKLYRKIRAVIIPSIWHEPWPYVVVEAIIRGRFVIASRVGGIPEQVEGCKGALICEPRDYEQFAEAIEFVGSLKRETIIDLGFQNRETFLRRFDNETTVRRFIGVCENLA